MKHTGANSWPATAVSPEKMVLPGVATDCVRMSAMTNGRLAYGVKHIPMRTPNTMIFPALFSNL